jgi:histidinol-phosphatase (PHP family)
MQHYVDQAKALGMMGIGFSSHAPVPFDTKWCMKAERLEEYINAVNVFKKTENGMEVYAGLEVDFIPDVTSPEVFNKKLDYTIGSIHFIDKLPEGPRWEIDGAHAVFLDGLKKIFNNNIQAAIARYFELTREMISTACPTVIGHLDKIKIQNVDGKFFSESESWYQQEVQKTIDLIASAGAIVEVNTRGIYQKKSDTTYPSPWILTYLSKKNIPITISSDAHHPKDLVNQFSETAAILHNIGFKTISILSDGAWRPFPFDEHGVIR